MMNEEKTKSFAVSKQMVYNSYLKVCDKKGGAGIDKETIEMFNANLSGNLYKVWNRMASGSYFPPAVRTVLIPKKQGGTRPLGIPTVGDRIAQGVVKDFLEPVVEPLFHGSSFGYRPGRSAHGALAQCQQNCIRYSWVVDLDIRGFFDNISHEWMMKMVEHHTQDKWVLLYISRWLKAGIEQADGSIAARQKGTPQGGVISPLLANLYLHHAFDMWMGKYFPSHPFERYADDIIEISRDLGLSDIIFVGHSVAAMMGIIAANKAPDLFSKLVLVGPSPYYINEGDYQGGFTHVQIDELLEALENNHLGWSMAMAPVIMGNPGRKELAGELENSFCRTDPKIARQFARTTFLSDAREALPTIHIPTLILQCSEDVIAPRSVGEYVHERIAGSKIVYMKATGHCPNLSAPDETIEAIKTFLA